MALYRGTVNLSGLESGFNPENPGSIGQVLTKTATGYNWQNGGGGGGGTYTAGAGINIDANNEISNTLPGAIVSATAPSNPTEGMVRYDTTNDALKAYNGTSWETEGTKMVVLEYGVSTWQNFIDAYNKNAIVYCKVSSGGSGYRMAFMAYTTGSSTPTEVEFQYYRSRSSHSTDATQLDEVYVYKLTDAGVWTTITRNTGAKMIAGTGIGLTFNSSGATISADTTTLATKTYVDDKSTIVSATTPSSPTEGMLWYDTTNDVLKTYDGTNWNNVDTDTIYYAGDNITIGDTRVTHQDTQGPCPDGFHIPTLAEFTALFSLFNPTHWEQSSASDFVTYAHLSMGGYLEDDGTWRDPSVQFGTLLHFGDYWLSDSINNGTPSGRCIGVNDDGSSIRVLTSVSNDINKGYMIRPFKDAPVIPDGSAAWVKEANYGTGDIGIWHNVTEGLISFTEDGTNWITIADKNLGATTVWNIGDAATAANSGNYFQRGNNHAFAWGQNASPTSSTSVDVTGYGPGNYYNNSTFITTVPWGTGSDWANLWGGISKGTWNTGHENTISADVNFKKFTLSATSGATALAEAQEICDWILDGNSAVVVYNDGSKDTEFYCSAVRPTYINFNSVSRGHYYPAIGDNVGAVQVFYSVIQFTKSGGTVTGINYVDRQFFPGYIPTSGIGGSGFTPTLDAHPATKKYVDDNVKTYYAGDNITITDEYDYSAMQGPCSSGFHIPTKDEWDAVNTAGIAMGAWAADDGQWAIEYLYLPSVGYRDFTEGGEIYSGEVTGYYRTCTCNEGVSSDDSYCFKVEDGGFAEIDTGYRSNGYSIRPFKDVPVIPDSSWTRVYTYNTNYGIFHNATLGLVSLSTNGTTWYTLADKNVGATVVYDTLDAQTDTNCGKLFQWGNNYGFTGPDNSGGISPTSSTQVDASGYGPGNYYSSSTFIISNSGDTDNEDWSSVRNSNLRGGDTGVVTTQNIISAPDVVISGDNGVTYTIKVSSSAPSGASSTTITLVP